MDRERSDAAAREENGVRGFTLIEIIIYVALFAIAATLLGGILLTATQVGQQESGSAEVMSQLNFVTQTIERFIQSSSNIDLAASQGTSTLKLRMEDPAKDPTCISLASGTIQLAQGPDQTSPQNCTSNTVDLTTDKVVVNSLQFRKMTQYPGHDTVSIDVAMSYRTTNPQGAVSRTLSAAVARVSAATFDADVLPGGSYAYNLGQSGTPWQNIYASGFVSSSMLQLSGQAADPSCVNGAIYYNTTQGFRGCTNSAWGALGGSGGYWIANGNNIYNTNSGNVGVGTSTFPSRFTAYGGDVYVSSQNSGLKLRNIDDTNCHRLTVTKSNLIVLTPIDCTTDAVITASSTVATRTTGKTVFVTSGTYQGIFGGWSAANSICQSLANTASLTGTFYAWLSDETYSPAGTFSRSTVPYVLVDGTAVANSWNDLMTGNLLHAINEDERGNVRGDYAWTNANAIGGRISTLMTQTCGSGGREWVTNFGINGWAGSVNAMDSTWTAVSIVPCANAVRLYCFQQ